MLLYGKSTRYAVLEHDSWPLVASAQLDGPLDALHLLVQPFMGGVFADALHRPTHALVLGLTHSVCGMNPVGYQVVQIATYGAAALALWFLIRRLAARAGLALGPWVAAIPAGLFLAHPIAWQIVPASARGNDPLLLLLLATSLTLALAERFGAGRAVVLAVTTFLAFGVKETSVLLLPLALVLCVGASGARGLRGRLADAGRRLAPILAGFVAMACLRLTAIGPQPMAALRDWRSSELLELLRFVLLPVPEVAAADWFAPLALVTWLGVAAACLLRLRAARAHRAATAAWIAAGLILSLVAGIIPLLRSGWREWHAYLPLAGFTLLASLALGGLLEAWRERERRRAGWFSLGLAPAAALALCLAPSAAVLTLEVGAARATSRAEQWASGSAMEREFLGRLEPQILAARPGDSLWLDGVPLRGPLLREGPRVISPSVLSGQSVRSWVRLRFPDLPIRVIGPLGRGASHPERITVAIDVDVIDFERPDHRWRRAHAALAELGPQAAEVSRQFDRAVARREYESALVVLVVGLQGAGPGEVARAARADLIAYLHWIGREDLVPRLERVDFEVAATER
ncbi:hypothetical protein Pla86_42370 [Planctomycetes bacterium Pla86]|uniref:Glycosyltransferase RgtA/B/C/D-like domain-containing protein n=1 Tax=Engelhardtia mirabilis TaxID=2528011 RepID=A0A518BQ72_9BACT|nr:hypothetical protein Pla133_42380 [Planctomycetes bacterium Pla133]QDV03449.1 hypothetical protein Pla86_42370 [Planctomycetes bacterium Pla86]